MSVKVNLVNQKLQKDQPKEFYRYTEKELTKNWFDDKGAESFLCHYKDYYVLCLIDNLDEAIVVAAMFMREFNEKPEQTFYDILEGILYLNMYDAVRQSTYTIDDCIDMLDGLYKLTNIESINVDRWGQALMYKNAYI